MDVSCPAGAVVRSWLGVLAVLFCCEVWEAVHHWVSHCAVGRVGVVEPGNELAGEGFVGEILVNESGFGVAEIQPRVRGVNKASRLSNQKQM